jgi:hypothetical protein
VASSPRRGLLTPRVFCFGADGGSVVKTNAPDSCVVDTRGLRPGLYRLRAYVYQGASPRHQAEAEAVFEVTASTCDKAPKGWSCTRSVGHDGPCAAIGDAKFGG